MYETVPSSQDGPCLPSHPVPPSPPSPILPNWRTIDLPVTVSEFFLHEAFYKWNHAYVLVDSGFLWSARFCDSFILLLESLGRRFL